MDDAIKVKAGSGRLRLHKSSRLVGLKAREEQKDLEEQAFVDRKHYDNLAGFKVVSLDQGDRSLDEALDLVRQDEDVALGTHVYFAEGSDRPLVPTGEIYLNFEEGTSEEEQQIALDEFHLELVERRDATHLVARVTANSRNPVTVAAMLVRAAMVRSAEPDLDSYVDSYEFPLPPDPLLPHQWHFKNEGRVPDAQHALRRDADAKILDAWARLGNLGSSSIAIAVLDNGFDLYHPDFQGKIHRPYDLWNQSSQLTQGNPRFTHGTPCASLALAASTGRGMVGVAPEARFMPVNGISFGVRATEQMFDYCVRNGAHVISCSWGSTDAVYALGAEKNRAIAQAARQGRGGKGCVVVFAVGNDSLNYVNFYAAHPDVIAVASSTSQDQHASYSNQGPEVTVCAPSNGDWPLIAARCSWDQGSAGQQGNYRFWADGRSRGDQYKHFGGTSASAPIVAGICALMLSANPDLTAKEVKEILQRTADKIGAAHEYRNGHSQRYGYGRVNADKAVAEAMRRKAGSHGPMAGGGSSHTGTPGTRPPVSQPTVSQPPAPRPSAAQGDRWGVQVGVFSDAANARGLANRLAADFQTEGTVEQVDSQGRVLFRVVVGAYAEIAQANTLQQRLQTGGHTGFVKKLQG